MKTKEGKRIENYIPPIPGLDNIRKGLSYVRDMYIEFYERSIDGQPKSTAEYRGVSEAP